MKIEVRYYSKTGNTKKVAEAVAAAVGAAAVTVNTPIIEKTDILFFGSAVYAAGVADEVKAFFASLSPELVKNVVCFSTAALLPSTYRQIKKLCKAKGISVCEKEFHCRGHFKFAHVGRPNEADLAAAAAFAEAVVRG